MPDIAASKPVTAPAVPSIVYDKWFVVRITGSLDATKGPLSVVLNRAAKTPQGWLLMPNETQDAQVTVTLDVWKESVNTPEVAAAIEAITAAVVSYGTKKKLL